MVKWEYKIIDYKRNILSKITLDEELSLLGFEGWELVSFAPVSSIAGGGQEIYSNLQYTRFVFKRPLQVDEGFSLPSVE